MRELQLVEMRRQLKKRLIDWSILTINDFLKNKVNLIMTNKYLSNFNKI